MVIFPGRAIASTIYLAIPSNFTQSNFTASLVVDGSYWNGTASIPLNLTGTAEVFLLSLTPAGTQPAVTITRSGDVSSSLFAVGVITPSVVVVILLVLLARGRGRPRDAERQ
jgi:ABC-type microcin C transport system permease subunit YejB